MENEWDVGKLLGVSSAYWRGCALQAGVRLKVFTHLGEDECSAQDISVKAGTETRATGLMLDALAAINLLTKREGCYRNTPFSKQFLVENSPAYMGHIILHHHHILDGWAQLDQAVTTGKRVNRRHYGEDAERRSFLLGMYNLAKGLAPVIARQIPLEGRMRLLDLGGGPGTYAIHFCLANPEMKGVIFDKPATEPFARNTVAHYKLSDRIDFIGGDFTADPPLGGPYDVAWLSHILHSNSMTDCQTCIKQTVSAMAPGGMILIHDFILNDGKDGPEFPALFALNMLVGTERGRTYSAGEIITMLEQAGIADISHHPFRAPNDSSVILGVKKS